MRAPGKLGNIVQSLNWLVDVCLRSVTTFFGTRLNRIHGGGLQRESRGRYNIGKQAVEAVEAVRRDVFFPARSGDLRLETTVKSFSPLDTSTFSCISNSVYVSG